MDKNIYSFRAETVTDVENLKAVLPGDYIITPLTLSLEGKEIPIPDVEVKLTTEKSLEEAVALMNKVIDGHRMVETIQHLKNHNGKRKRKHWRL